jgi:hypothetical protein
MQQSSPISGEPSGMILVYPTDSDIPTIRENLRNLRMNQVA